MTEKTKAPASGGALAEAVDGNSCGEQLAMVGFHSSINERNGQVGVSDLLGRGVQNAISTKTLIQMAGMKSARQLQAAIEMERANGSPILSSNGGGYYLPADDPEQARYEINDFIKVTSARAVNTMRTVNAVRTATGYEST